ncbi:MAG TPA: MarR family winged helix-turn-helix transcriptional regulator [Propionibacteriaceae bacterium]|nr:MarR family winged helix-turn-helix transcriptional regulator [Propionibacteriaceae bacterium]
MNIVKAISLAPLPDHVEAHVAVLTERLMQLVRQSLLSQDWGGLRIVHFRLLSCVPATGATITALAEPLSMTKQAVGQFVTQLEQSGHVRLSADQTDRRRRIVLRTALGDRTVDAVNAAIAGLEHEWATQVGPERYAHFLSVLRELALP